MKKAFLFSLGLFVALSSLFVSCSDNNGDGYTPPASPYVAVDLGLPSGLKWASCNIGATVPEEYGSYFAWGEVSPKSSYYESNSVICDKGMSDISGNAQYDVARANWGANWRMPTKQEQEELCNDCTWQWTTLNGVNGYKVTGPNGNSIFLPAAGYRYGTSLTNEGAGGYYWSSTPYETYAYPGGGADYLYFGSDDYGWRGNYRYYGQSVRPVCE